MFGVAKPTEAGHECKVRKHLTSLGLQASLALEQASIQKAGENRQLFFAVRKARRAAA